MGRPDILPLDHEVYTDDAQVEEYINPINTASRVI